MRTIHRFGFVILHYQVPEATIRCVESIINNVTDDYAIVVVDNASPDDSGSYLQGYFKDITRISVLLNRENLGFARGHNVGYEYAKTQLLCDCIVLLNNDTKIVQKDFTKVIRREYEYSGCEVMGPSIYDAVGITNDNPGRSRPFDRRRLLAFIALNHLLVLLNTFHMDYIPEKIYEAYVSSRRQSVRHIRTENVAIHGCCIVLLPSFINRSEGLNPGTFMYMEEDVLYEEIIHNDGLIVYQPELMIEHMSAVSTSSSISDAARARRFKYINTIRSARVLYRLKKTWLENENS